MASSSRAQSIIALLLCLNLVISSTVSALTAPKCSIDYKQELGPQKPDQCKAIRNLITDEAADCICSAVKDNIYGVQPKIMWDAFVYGVLSACKGPKYFTRYHCA